MSTDVGQKAEQAAARHLQQLGYRVLERNWRTRWCEIDIVAQKGSTVYFVEVKYRRTTFQGNGLDYITPRKLQQMHFAAEMWLARHGIYRDYRLSACELTGQDFVISAWIDDIN